MGIAAGLLAATAGIVYFFSANWAWPFRLGGAYEAYANGRLFDGSSISVSPTDQTIVFASPQTGKGDIYSVGRVSRTQGQLTNNRNYEGNPSFSPDGKLITFEREERYCSHIWIMNSDGTAQRQVTSSSGYDTFPRFGPDGKTILFTRTFPGSRVAYSFATDLDRQYERSTRDGKLFLEYEPTYPACGYPIYFRTGTDDIWKLNPDWTKADHVAKGASPTISPNGRVLVFLTSPFELSAIDLGTHGVRTIYKSVSDRIEHPEFCPDGQHVLFVEQTAPALGADHHIRVSEIGLDGMDYHIVFPIL